RNADAGPLQLDLTQVYTRAPDSVTDMKSNTASLRGYPWGLARLNGVDYDVRGIAEANWNRPHEINAITRIRVPPIPIAAFHVLLDAPRATPAAEQRDYAYLRLHYRDGSSALLPIRTGRDVPGLTRGGDDSVPIGWASGGPQSLIGMSRKPLTSNPRLANPYPQKLIVSLELEASTKDWSFPSFLAVTAEPRIACGHTANPEAEGAVAGETARPGRSKPRNPQ